MNVKNSVLKPVLITFLVMLITLTATLSVMHFFFPLNLSNWFYSMGANKTAVYYMERSYKKSEDYNQLYSLVNLNIKTNNYEKTEKCFELFYKNENYNNFVLNVDANNLTKNVSNLVKSTLYSEDNYLKNKYILALVKQGKVEKAFEFATKNSSLLVSNNNVGIYVYNNIFTQGVNVSSLENLGEFGANLVTYFEQNINLFNECANVNNMQKVKGLVLGSRINEIGKNLKMLKGINENYVGLTHEQINAMVLAVSEKMTLFV